MRQDTLSYLQNNKIIPLGWDSRFFGYKVAQVRCNHLGNKILDELLQEIKSSNIRLTYFFIPPSEIELNRNIIIKGGLLVDQKTIFSKNTQPHSEFNNVISEFNGTELNEKLIELGLQAGIFSRFNIDKNFVNKEFERLYSQWILNSINKSLAFKIIVVLFKNDIIGLTTIGEKNSYADIGLVSVDKKFRGKGIGPDLINFADNIAFEMKYDKIKVVTQLQNTRACSLYEKCNFSIESVTNVYHFWN